MNEEVVEGEEGSTVLDGLLQEYHYCVIEEVVKGEEEKNGHGLLEEGVV